MEKLKNLRTQEQLCLQLDERFSVLEQQQGNKQTVGEN
jgi:hypothetical protein